MNAGERQLDQLTGVRGFAALWVLFHHLPNIEILSAPIAGSLFAPIADKGWLGVDLFYVLSGFVISFVHLDEFASPTLLKLKRFLALRVGRLYPAHLTTTLALVVLVLLAQHFVGYQSPKDAFNLRKLWLSLSLLHGWGIPNSEGWNLPSWTVSSEWFAYLMFPLMAVLLARMRARSANLAGTLLVLVVVYALAFAINAGKQFMLPWSFTLVRVISEFSLGCMLFNLYRTLKGAFRFDLGAAVAILFVLLFSQFTAAAIADGFYVVAFCLLILCLSRSVGPMHDLFASRVMVYLGTISYSVYLCHGLVLMVVNQVSKRVISQPTTLLMAVTFVAMVGLSLTAGDLLFRFVEQPFRRWTKRQVQAMR